MYGIVVKEIKYKGFIIRKYNMPWSASSKYYYKVFGDVYGNEKCLNTIKTLKGCKEYITLNDKGGLNV